MHQTRYNQMAKWRLPIQTGYHQRTNWRLPSNMPPRDEQVLSEQGATKERVGGFQSNQCASKGRIGGFLSKQGITKGRINGFQATCHHMTSRWRPNRAPSKNELAASNQNKEAPKNTCTQDSSYTRPRNPWKCNELLKNK